MRRPITRASHIPERAQQWRDALEPELANQGELAFYQRPLKLLDHAERIAVLYATPDGYPKSFRWRGKVREVGASGQMSACAIITGSRMKMAPVTGYIAMA